MLDRWEMQQFPQTLITNTSMLSTMLARRWKNRSGRRQKLAAK